MSKSLHKLINKIQDDELKKEFQDWYYSNIVELRKEYLVCNSELEKANCRYTFIENIQYTMSNFLLDHSREFIIQSFSEDKSNRNTLLISKLTMIKGEL